MAAAAAAASHLERAQQLGRLQVPNVDAAVQTSAGHELGGRAEADARLSFLDRGQGVSERGGQRRAKRMTTGVRPPPGRAPAEERQETSDWTRQLCPRCCWRSPHPDLPKASRSKRGRAFSAIREVG